jgi:phosphoglycerate dehydrogenase-like enzyme
MLEGNMEAMLLHEAAIGVIGSGNLGRAFLPLFEPFRATVRVFDLWLPDSALLQMGVFPCTLWDVLARSRFAFGVATVTEQTEHLLAGEQLDLLPLGARLLLVSRARVVDYEAVLDRVQVGRLLAGIDVWPDEPVPPDHLARQLDGLVLSARRAGGIPEAVKEIGPMVVDDLTLIALGLPPVGMQVAARELVGGTVIGLFHDRL